MGDAKISRRELRLVEAQAASVLLTACALLLSAFVQAATYGMSTYHAVIILNLGWVNSINVFICLQLLGYRAITLLRGNKKGAQESVREDVKHSNWTFFVGSLHLSILGAFGLWFWKTVDTFGAASQCAPRLPVPLRILGHDVAVTSSTLRKASLAIYGIIIVPYFNVVGGDWLIGTCAHCAACSVCCCCTAALLACTGRRGANSIGTYLELLVWAGISLAITIDTESMISRMKPFVAYPGESQWTFGQTLALFLLLLPFLELIRGLRTSYDE